APAPAHPNTGLRRPRNLAGSCLERRDPRAISTGRPDRLEDQDSVALPFSGNRSNRLILGKPFGASRPASARLLRQSASSLSESVKVRSAVSTQVRPSAALNVLMSDNPPSL